MKISKLSTMLIEKLLMSNVKVERSKPASSFLVQLTMSFKLISITCAVISLMYITSSL